MIVTVLHGVNYCWMISGSTFMHDFNLSNTSLIILASHMQTIMLHKEFANP